jgi:ABC-type amino acid transport substrate-binding protein
MFGYIFLAAIAVLSVLGILFLAGRDTGRIATAPQGRIVPVLLGLVFAGLMFGYIYLAAVAFLAFLGVLFLGRRDTGRSVTAPRGSIVRVLSGLVFAGFTYPLGGGDWIIGFPVPAASLHFGERGARTDFVFPLTLFLMLPNFIAGAAFAHVFLRGRHK